MHLFRNCKKLENDEIIYINLRENEYYLHFEVEKFFDNFAYYVKRPSGRFLGGKKKHLSFKGMNITVRKNLKVRAGGLKSPGIIKRQISFWEDVCDISLL